MFAGIDTHKDTLAVAVIDAAGRQRAGCEVPNTEAGFAQLGDLFTRHRVTRVGIEGSGSFGRAVAVHLAITWQHSSEVRVVEVPTLMTSRERRSQVGKGKTDPVDALAVASITAREDRLPPVRLTVGPAADLRALLAYREDLVAERTALIGRVHAEMVGLVPGYQRVVPTLANRARVRKLLTVLAGDDSLRAGLTRRRLERVIAIDTEVADLTRDVTSLVASSGSSLPQMYGIGPIVAARFLAEVVDIGRYPNRNAFALPTAPPRSPPPPGAPCGTGTTPAATASSTVPCTPSPSPRSEPIPMAGRTTTANARQARPAVRRCAASNASCPTWSSRPCAPTPTRLRQPRPSWWWWVRPTQNRRDSQPEGQQRDGRCSQGPLFAEAFARTHHHHHPTRPQRLARNQH